MENKKSRQLHMMAAFLAMEPINVLMSIARELGRGSITEEVQIFIHEQCINNRICRNYPPNQLYVKNFLKKIIAEAESQFIEVLDILYEQYAQYLTYCKVHLCKLGLNSILWIYSVPSSVDWMICCKW